LELELEETPGVSTCYALSLAKLRRAFPCLEFRVEGTAVTSRSPVGRGLLAWDLMAGGDIVSSGFKT